MEHGPIISTSLQIVLFITNCCEILEEPWSILHYKKPAATFYGKLICKVHADQSAYMYLKCTRIGIIDLHLSADRHWNSNFSQIFEKCDVLSCFALRELTFS